MSNLENEFYKQKYLKYKSKYTELKYYKFNINSKQKGGLNENIDTYKTSPPTIEDLFLSNKESVKLLENIIINHEDNKEYLKKLKENIFIKNNMIDLLISNKDYVMEYINHKDSKEYLKKLNENMFEKNNIIDLLICNKDYVIKYINNPINVLDDDLEGYDENGYYMYGYNINGYDQNGYDMYGYNINGYDQNGYDRYGFNPITIIDNIIK